MMIAPALPPVPPPLQPAPTTPQQNAALATAALAAQKTAQPVQTQTTRAPAAVARSEAGRENQSSTFQGYAFDAEAQVVRAKSPPGRGSRVNVTV